MPSSTTDRIAVIGASLTQGLGTSRELGFDIPFAMIFDHMLLRPHEEARSFSGPTWYSDPVACGASIMKRVEEFRATMLVGIDFPFWFAYARTSNEQQRVERVLAALEQLDAWMQTHDGPVFVGTVPGLDRTKPLQFVLDMIIAPENRTLGVINDQITRWAAARPRVVLVPLKAWLDEIRGQRALDIGTVRWPARSRARLLQPDGLHPSVEAICAMAHLVLAEVSRMPGALGVKDFDPEPQRFARDLLAFARNPVKHPRPLPRRPTPAPAAQGTR